MHPLVSHISYMLLLFYDHAEIYSMIFFVSLIGTLVHSSLWTIIAERC